MSKPTPEQLRVIEKCQAEFERHWLLDPLTKEIKRKPVGWLKKLGNFFWKDRQTVFALYWWCKKRWFQSDAMPFTFPIANDNMPIKGFPVKYELQGGWTIPKSDLKYLYKGPLASEGLSQILVQHQLGWQKFVLLFNQLKPIGSVVVFIGACIRYWPELKQFWEYLTNGI